MRQPLNSEDPFPGNGGRLLGPAHEPLFREVVMFVYVEVTDVLYVRRLRRPGLQLRAAQEGHLDLAAIAVERETPALSLDPIEGSVPTHCFADARRVLFRNPLPATH